MLDETQDKNPTWVQDRQRRESRRRAIESFMTVVGAHVALLSLLLQLRYGLLRHVPGHGGIGTAVMAALPLLSVSMVVSPTRSIKVAKQALRGLSLAVFGTASKLVLAAVFLLTLPIALVYGRRNLLTRHHVLGPWVSPRHGDWSRSEWVPKGSEAVQANRSSRSPAWRLLGYFAAQRNILMLVITAIIIVVLSVSLLSHSPTLAPFVYPLF
jgi:hypothetical protein